MMLFLRLIDRIQRLPASTASFTPLKTLVELTFVNNRSRDYCADRCINQHHKSLFGICMHINAPAKVSTRDYQREGICLLHPGSEATVFLKHLFIKIPHHRSRKVADSYFGLCDLRMPEFLPFKTITSFISSVSKRVNGFTNGDFSPPK